LAGRVGVRTLSLGTADMTASHIARSSAKKGSRLSLSNADAAMALECIDGWWNMRLRGLTGIVGFVSAMIGVMISTRLPYSGLYQNLLEPSEQMFVLLEARRQYNQIVSYL